LIRFATALTCLPNFGPMILKFAVAAAAVSCTREGAMTSVPALAEIQPLLIHTPHAR